MARALRLAVAAVLASASIAAAQTRAGGEFRINTYTSGEQFLPAAASARDGSFVVSWGSYPGQDGDLAGAFARRYDAAGAALGGEFQVNTYTTGFQTGFDQTLGVALPASAARDRRGNSIVTWTSTPGQDGSGGGVFGQRYDAGGTRRGGEFRVNSFTTGDQLSNQVAMAPDGRFVVVWASAAQDGQGLGVFGQRFDASGSPAGAEFRVNAFTTGDQADPDVAVAPDGSFVVVWQSDGQDGSYAGIFGRRISADGAALGTEFRVNTFTTDDQLHAVAAMDGAGNFVVVWHSVLQDDPVGAGVYAQRYDAAGGALGTEFRVNSFTPSYQFYPSVSRDETGGFVVTWFGVGLTDLTLGTFGQRFAADGVRRGPEFQANTYIDGYQGLGEVASDDVGNFLVTWTNVSPQDGSGMGAFGQRYGGLRPSALRVDVAGNQVWDPGETAVVQPSWRNVNGAAQAFGGVLGNLTGPAGATYTITQPNAAYGTVANGATQACTTCYGVSVSNPPARPAAHWDARADERITPDTQGQVKRWTLHIGGSFTDVPGSNPFYRFVETLLHNGVTGGCAGGQYCPASSTTRDQMSVFVLVAKEGAGYAPPACGTPVFGDVPASSPFCRFIEELARRGVVTGCAPNLYCPAAPVTREQMAIFVLRTLDGVLSPPACTAGAEMFADVPASSPFCRWIEELARRGVVTGCGSGNYCPASPVTREQMGVFIGATFGLTLYGP